ncbi:hemolysin-III related-domain-containing protein [Zychaea mexicana]|uniref:hemolysin-III related-domain-containing protein n=1 Tax=Zychaea mexicana TaxID=64656 RepID=UPI0022FE93A0|nr:hemolysin-III related-domain-containing protein [Zychaea mexicana]KAI9492618.1 hemolysin-III related-domain-containing protein [Zychaea mexicana]
MSNNKQEGFRPLLTEKDDSTTRRDYQSSSNHRSCLKEQKTYNNGQRRLLTWSEIPEWMRFNPYILGSYRPPNSNYWTCVKSVLEWHNETLNIWTHLLGLIGILCYLGRFLYWQGEWNDKHAGESIFSVGTTADLLLFTYFIFGSGCLACSCVYHIFACHSKSVSVACNSIDYLGIIFNNIGSWLLVYHYYFYCEPHLQTFYIFTYLVVCGTAAAMLVIPRFQAEEYMWMRTITFVFVGFAGVTGFVHAGLLHGTDMMFEIGLGRIFITSFFYVSGALVFGLRWPERSFPGRCDIWFQSHTIFHILCLCAMIAYYFAMVQAREFWGAEGAYEQYCSTATTLSVTDKYF